MANSNVPYVISVDWLQVYAHMTSSFEDGEHTAGAFKLIVQNKHTRFYSKLADVQILYANGHYVPFAELLFQPNSNVLDPRSCHIKVLNEQLYTSNWFENLTSLMRSFSIEFRGVTRCDLCYDCNVFVGGLKPEDLLFGYLTQKYLKIGVNRCSAQIASMGYAFEEGSEDIETPGELVRPAITGVTWGSITSGKQHVIYNKSLEMREVKYKPWIVERWYQHGLDASKVWRCEIRISGRGKELMFQTPENLFQMGISEIADQDRIEELFAAYAMKLFRFVENNGTVVKQRMQPISLFEMRPASEIDIAPRTHRIKQALGRTVKVVRNSLITWFSWVKNHIIETRDIHLEEALDRVILFADSIIPRFHVQGKEPTMPEYFRLMSEKMIEEGDFGLFDRQLLFDTFGDRAMRHDYCVTHDVSAYVRRGESGFVPMPVREVLSLERMQRSNWSEVGAGCFCSPCRRYRYNVHTRTLSTLREGSPLPVYDETTFHPYYVNELNRYARLL